MRSTRLIPTAWAAACPRAYALASLPGNGMHVLMRVRPNGADLQGLRVNGMFPADEQTKVQIQGATKPDRSDPSPWRPPEE